MKNNLQAYPGNFGYRMPAEWERHEATWLSWPHNQETWPELLPAVEKEMVSLVSALTQSEAVRINVLDEKHEEHVWRLLSNQVPGESVHFCYLPTNDAWCRDCGAIFVTNHACKEQMLALKFRYNAWGGKYLPYNLDQVVADSMAKILSVPVFESELYLEGGAFDVNGSNVLMTTENCVLKRNPKYSRNELEKKLKNTFGVRQIIWLEGGIEGDDTDGHVDQFARFVDRDIVLIASEGDNADPNYLPLKKNREKLINIRLTDEEEAVSVVELPMPDPIYYRGKRLPASYANFYIANEHVLVPAFGCPQDNLARKILEDLFASRDVISIDCRSIVAGFGAIHCLTQQIPYISVNY